MKRYFILLNAIALMSFTHLACANELQALQVSTDGHYLQYDNGEPFFYLGDTAWELFHRTTRDEVDRYLDNRASKGYNVIQAVALAEVEGVDIPNVYGHKPLIDRDPARPATKEGDNNDYWDHVDYVVRNANAKGMYVGLLPTWGRWWNDNKPIFDEQNAEAYGRWIAQRYQG